MLGAASIPVHARRIINLRAQTMEYSK